MDSSIIVMAKEFIKKNIRVNAIRPANISYENNFLTQKANNVISYTKYKELMLQTEEISKKMLTGDIKVNNIAEQIAFLQSDCSSGITGQCLDVKGYL